MQITKAVFKRGLKGSDDLLLDGTPQVAFIGRSNAGKSSLINSLTNQKNLAIASKTPGRTQEINIFAINNGTHYFLDLPGYGFAKADGRLLEKLGKLIYWYFFDSGCNQTVVLIIDAEVGPTTADIEMLRALEKAGKDIVIVANKVDKIKSSQYENQLKKLRQELVGHTLYPYSSKTKVGTEPLLERLLS